VKARAAMKATTFRTATFGPYALDVRSGELRKFGTKIKMGEQSFLTLHLADRQYDRLRSYLIKRKPDTMIGYSILIFQLSDQDFRAALLP
jgi:hypothetical protein